MLDNIDLRQAHQIGGLKTQNKRLRAEIVFLKLYCHTLAFIIVMLWIICIAGHL